MSRLADRPDFHEAITAAAGSLRLPAPIVEKDYWVTQALRAARESHPDDWIFKGGTSLSKGYRLIQRFSEDIDVLVLPRDRGATARDRAMKDIAASAATSLGLTGLPPSVTAQTGVHRTYALEYTRLAGRRSRDGHPGRSDTERAARDHHPDRLVRNPRPCGLRRLGAVRGASPSPGPHTRGEAPARG